MGKSKKVDNQVGELLERLSESKKKLTDSEARIAQLESDRSRLEKELKFVREENVIIKDNDEQKHRSLIKWGNRFNLMREHYETALKRLNEITDNICDRGRIRAKHDPLYAYCRGFTLAGFTDYKEIATKVALKVPRNVPQFSIHRIMQLCEEMRGKEFTDAEQASIIAEYQKQSTKTWTASWSKAAEGAEYDIIATLAEKSVTALTDEEDKKALNNIEGSTKNTYD